MPYNPKTHKLVKVRYDEIYQYYLNTNTRQTALHFGISANAVKSAIKLAEEELEKRKIKPEPKQPTREDNLSPVERLIRKSGEILEIAEDIGKEYSAAEGELLRQVRHLKERLAEAEDKLKKAHEEKDRTLRAYNEVMKQVGSDVLPTMDSILAALRRQHMVDRR